jgi:hypothetical protein
VLQFSDLASIMKLSLKSSVFSNVILYKSSNRSILVSYLAYSLTLKMEDTRSSETSVDFERTTLHYSQEDRECRMPRNISFVNIQSVYNETP